LINLLSILSQKVSVACVETAMFTNTTASNFAVFVFFMEMQCQYNQGGLDLGAPNVTN
jgi:hypothetical protein